MESPWKRGIVIASASCVSVRFTRPGYSAVTNLVRHVPSSTPPSSVPAGELPGRTRGELAGLSGLLPRRSMCLQSRAQALVVVG